MDYRLRPAQLATLNGTEEILKGIQVLDFWRWSLGDLRLNSTRGFLSQFLVAKAVGDSRPYDEGWGAYDVLSADGLKIEVKTGAYLQSWAQQELSKITFSGLITRRWDEESGYSEPMVLADVYVFAVQTCQDPIAYDPLDLNSWDFYVIAGQAIANLGQKTIGLSRVKQLSGGPVKWEALSSTVTKTYEERAILR